MPELILAIPLFLLNRNVEEIQKVKVYCFTNTNWQDKRDELLTDF